MCPHLFADGHPQGTAHSVQNEVMSGHVFQTKAALQAAPFAEEALAWREAVDAAAAAEDAVAALKLVHTIDHLRGLVEMSKTGGGFDTDTYCAPGSWEAMLDGTRAWMEATSLAMAGEGPAFALSRPAGSVGVQNARVSTNFVLARQSIALSGSPVRQTF